MAPVTDVPPQIEERVVCSLAAAIQFGVPANILLAIAEIENGKPGQWVRNANGTDDVGPMQFNTVYLEDLQQYGITPEDVAAAGCYSYQLAAWRLRHHLHDDKGDVWQRAANYHSYTPQFNEPYRAALIKAAGRWQWWIEARFQTYDSTGGAGVTSTSVKQTGSGPAPTNQDRSPKASAVNQSAFRALAAVYTPGLVLDGDDHDKGRVRNQP